MKILTLAVAALVSVGLAGLSLSPASAQYPPATGNVALAVADATPTVGDAVSIAASVRDSQDTPITGQTCSFSIASQPGTDARLLSNAAVTDSNGIATADLDVGSTPGTILVDAVCGGMSSRISVVAGAAVTAPVQPPTGQITPIQLPATGFGPGEGTGSTGLFWAELALALVAASGGLFLLLRARR